MSGTTTSGSAAVFHQPLSRLSVPNSGRASIPTGSSSPGKDEAGQAPLPLRVTRGSRLYCPGSGSVHLLGPEHFEHEEYCLGVLDRRLCVQLGQHALDRTDRQRELRVSKCKSLVVLLALASHIGEAEQPLRVAWN